MTGFRNVEESVVFPALSRFKDNISLHLPFLSDAPLWRKSGMDKWNFEHWLVASLWARDESIFSLRLGNQSWMESLIMSTMLYFNIIKQTSIAISNCVTGSTQNDMRKSSYDRPACDVCNLWLAAPYSPSPGSHSIHYVCVRITLP